MGGTSYSDSDYRARASLRATKGTPDFAYDSDIRTGKAAAVAHDILDPKKITCDPTGFLGRVSRDSPAHPEAVPIVFLLDVTGSNIAVARVVQKELPTLMGLLIREGFCPHPSILIGGIGDALTDRVPLQFGQFEAGSTELDAAIQSLYLEEGGGGQAPPSESYDLAIYAGAKLTTHDHFEKRGERGFFFMVGDENCRSRVRRDQVKAVLGLDIEADIPTADLVARLKEKYHVFFVMVNTSNHYADESIREGWRALLGPEHLLLLDDPRAICSLVGAQVGACTGGLEVTDAEDKLVASGVSRKHARSASKALSPVGGASGPVAKLPAGSGAGSGLKKF
jgi:hypothetical protein